MGQLPSRVLQQAVPKGSASGWPRPKHTREFPSAGLGLGRGTDSVQANSSQGEEPFRAAVLTLEGRKPAASREHHGMAEKATIPRKAEGEKETRFRDII